MMKINYWIHQIGMLCLLWGALFIPVGFLVGFRDPFIQVALSTSITSSLLFMMIFGEFDFIGKSLKKKFCKTTITKNGESE